MVEIAQWNQREFTDVAHISIGAEISSSSQVVKRATRHAQKISGAQIRESPLQTRYRLKPSYSLIQAHKQDYGMYPSQNPQPQFMANVKTFRSILTK